MSKEEACKKFKFSIFRRKQTRNKNDPQFVLIKENLTRSKQILTSKSKNGNNLFESKTKQMILPVWKKKKERGMVKTDWLEHSQY